MTITGFIEKLAATREEHGDLAVFVEGGIHRAEYDHFEADDSTFVVFPRDGYDEKNHPGPKRPLIVP